jgi:hypothetical protein
MSMKGLIILLISLAIAGSAGAADGLEAPEFAGVVPQADISGAGTFVFGGSFRIVAEDDAAGDSGVLEVRYLQGVPVTNWFVASLDCVKIVENTAIVSGIVTRASTFGWEIGQRVYYGIADRGSASEQPADGVTGYGPASAESCETVAGPGPFFSFVNVGGGNISITAD